MGEYLDKIKQKFEWYRFTLPRRHRAVFDKIVAKATDDELKTTPGGFDALVMTELIDIDERLTRLEDKSRY